MVPLCRQWQPEYAVMADDAAALALRNELASIGLKHVFSLVMRGCALSPLHQRWIW
ncbi:hypothetical protein JCM19236_5430 [Vibrio sp. JCM 19236]|nr:hypothetical protein JCM19236_5430 [Vibrio sp. JCM 19236]